MDIVSFDFTNKELFYRSIRIRKEVYVCEQNVSEELEMSDDGLDVKYFLLFQDKQEVATARYRQTKSGIKIERMAVLKSHRGKGLGTKLMEFILNELSSSTSEIYLNSQIQAVSLYLKNGFEPKGKHFYEAGIEHVKMIYSVCKKTPTSFIQR